MEKRLGFVGIVVQNRKAAHGKINDVLSEHGELILGRMGLPDVKGKGSVIALVVDANTDEMGDLTGKLGAIKGVTVKSAVAKK
jgi:putative iron-only hydrogenase system regulator